VPELLATASKSTSGWLLCVIETVYPVADAMSSLVWKINDPERVHVPLAHE
jgi:hypothetical protein